MAIRTHTRTSRLRAAVALLLAAPAAAAAQLPGAPVLQNAWANPGITVAANAATGGGARLFAGAAAWAPGSGRFQLSAGVGFRDAEAGGQGAAYGARVAIPVFNFAGGALGLAGFVGVGAAREPDAALAGEPSVGGTVTHVPVGAAIGFRRAFSFIRGVSVYAAPFYAYHRLSVGDSTSSGGSFRTSVGVDVGLTNRLGVTVGAEFGAGAEPGEPGPTGTVFGLGASLALGRR